MSSKELVSSKESSKVNSDNKHSNNIKTFLSNNEQIAANLKKLSVVPEQDEQVRYKFK